MGGRIEARIAAVAARQHGVVTRAQTLAAGASPDQIKRWLAAGRLHGIHRGVYAVGHSALSDLGRIQAALLAAPPGSVASHRTAGYLWEMCPWCPLPVDITSTTRTRGNHRTRHLPAHHTTRRKGLLTTTAARTILDLADVLPTQELRRIIGEAEYRRVVSRPQLLEVMRELPGRHGLRALMQLVPDGRPQPTHSHLEDRFLALVEDAGLPRPQSNVRILSFVVDFLWPDERLVVEIDGPHHDQRRREDAERDQRLAAAGYLTLRFPGEQLDERPLTVVTRVAVVLAGLSASAARASSG